jgi:general stress protein 26
MDDKQQATIHAFLKSQKLAVIATVKNKTHAPEAALVGFAEADDLTLYFQTQDQTRKAKNLDAHPTVAFVIGTQLEAATTVQYEGIVHVATKAEQAIGRQLLIDKDSPSVRFLDKPGTIMYKVTPTWIRYSNYNAGPPEVFEITL